MSQVKQKSAVNDDDFGLHIQTPPVKDNMSEKAAVYSADRISLS